MNFFYSSINEIFINIIVFTTVILLNYNKEEKKMEEKNVLRRGKKETKDVVITIRITKRLSKWMRDKNYSPSGLLMEACKEFGFKE